ncbi:MAG: hypothetical protein AAGJ35_12055, partial [Myxococcota bacterium]
MLKQLGRSFRKRCTFAHSSQKPQGWFTLQRWALLFCFLPTLIGAASRPTSQTSAKRVSFPSTHPANRKSPTPRPDQIKSLQTQKALSIEVVGVINAATADYIK